MHMTISSRNLDFNEKYNKIWLWSWYIKLLVVAERELSRFNLQFLFCYTYSHLLFKIMFIYLSPYNTLLSVSCELVLKLALVPS